MSCLVIQIIRAFVQLIYIILTGIFLGLCGY